MKCTVCDKSIPRGQRFIGDRYKAIKFCCEECYNKYCEEKDAIKAEKAAKTEAKKKERPPVPGWKELIEYIGKVFDHEVNWPYVAKQIRSYMDDYNVTCDDIRLAIKYAIVYENYVVNQTYGLGQFIPKYLEPSKNFKEQIQRNLLLSSTMTKPKTVVIKKTNDVKYYGKIEDFD